jgi:HK97 gp10 family phage protein
VVRPLSISVRFEGGAELAKTLDELSLRVQKGVMRAALEEGAEPIRLRASQMAPHAPGLPDLRANIGISSARSTEDGDIATVKVGPVKGFAYGLPQEIGTSFHAAQPFMRPAFGEAPRALGIIGASLWRALISRGLGSTRTSGGGGGLL